MSFFGSSFSFDGKSCEEFGLMLYDFDSTKQGNSSFAKEKIYEDRVMHRPRSIFYGSDYDDGLEFQLVFGADEYAASKGEDIDRQEMEAISAWLTGHNAYKWLVIDQPDMNGIRYHCIITELEMVEVGFAKWALSCKVHCDSPFAYMLPQTFTYEVNGTSDVILCSRSSANLPYSPTLSIVLNSGGDLSIMNHSDHDRVFSMAGVPAAAGEIVLNGENGILTCSGGLNLYQYCNFKFPRLVRGDNHLTISGNGTVSFTCEFPVNVGG